MDPELIADYHCVCGEGPLWHPIEKRLYWADIATARMFRYDPATGHHEQFYEGEPLGGFTFQADGSLLLFGAGGSVRTWHDGVETTIIAEIPEERGMMFNDVRADPRGRVFGGTVDPAGGSGRLYRLNLDGTYDRLLDGVRCSNGIGFTLDHRRMYYTDSMEYVIYLFDYDQATGALANQRVFVRSPRDGGMPDGMNVDAEGYVWSARWDGSCLVRHAPDGHEVKRITFPAKQVSSVVLGGEGYMDIYVTTAGAGDRAGLGPGSGALFRINLGICGLPEFLSRIRL